MSEPPVGRAARLGRRAAAVLPPALALGAGALEGAALQCIGRRGPDPALVEARLGLDPASARAGARAMAANAARTRNLRILWRDGIPAGSNIARPIPAAARTWDGRPVIFVPLPWGPWLGAAARVADLRTDIALLADLAPSRAAAWGVGLRRTGSTTVEAAASLKWAVDHLRGDGALVVPLVGRAERGIEVEALGQHLVVPQGIALLARRTGAPVVPVSIGWQRGHIELELHPAVERPSGDLTPAAWDVALIEALVAAMATVAEHAPERCDPRVLAIGAPALS